ncbi:hypothetical protein Sjap_011414 [Stephania japonica]|uniref:Uncharacterized protein n=1 Tax=Stephania japonica TaxID=461633 RepID=A0AAP0P4P6_9MAGN
MPQSYTQWINHGEAVRAEQSHNTVEESHEAADTIDDDDDDVNEGFDIFELLEDIHGGIFVGTNIETEPAECNRNENDHLDDNASDFYELLKKAQCRLYPGCKKFSALSFIVKLLFYLCVGPRKQGRRDTRGHGLLKLVKTFGKIKLNIEPEVGKPTCQNATKFSNECGVIVRSFVPQQLEHWYEMPKEKREEMHHRLLHQS